MALKKTVVTPQGFNAENAYLRVENVLIFEKNRISFQLRSYKNIDYPAFNDQGFSCAYDMAGNNPIAQAYMYLKTLPEFAGAIDC